MCYGHTGPEVKLGQTMTKAQCGGLLMADIAKHQTVLVGPKNCLLGAPLNQNQLDALTSLTFNLGTAKFCSSTLAKQVAIRRYDLAALEFTKWSNARVNGKLVPLPGLVKRRTAEKTLFMDKTARAPLAASGGPSAGLIALLK